MCGRARDYMKDFSQYGNRPDDQWEMLPWIPDPRPPFKIWVKPEQIAPFLDVYKRQVWLRAWMTFFH